LIDEAHVVIALEDRKPRWSGTGSMDAAKKFTLDVSSEGAAKLKAIVKAKLSEFIGNYSDDVLVEYVVVLVSHGKQPSQAIVDLEAFLGNESKAFVTWYVCNCSVSTNQQMIGSCFTTVL
jgi:hypothetical protein